MKVRTAGSSKVHQHGVVLTAEGLIRPPPAYEAAVLTGHLQCSACLEINELVGTKGAHVLTDTAVGGSAGKCSVWKPRSMWVVGGTVCVLWQAFVFGAGNWS